MLLFPFERLSFHTIFSNQEIQERLDAMLAPAGSAGSMAGVLTGKYEGSCNHKAFVFNSASRFAKPLLPRVDGVIINEHDGSRVDIIMRQHPLTLPLLLIWLAFIGIRDPAKVFILSSGLTYAQLLPITLIVTGYMAIMITFNIAAGKIKKDLAAIFETDIPAKR